jgi:hypothetical protein
VSERAQIVEIDPTGRLRFVYRDELQPLLALGTATIRRASHVEPDADHRWWADLAPSGGPLLGPFETRQAALDGEVAWLQREGLHHGLAGMPG